MDSAEELWKQTIAQFKDVTSDYGSYYDRVAIPAPNHLVVSFKAGYTLQKEGCERPERRARIEQVMQRLTGRSIRVDFEVLDGPTTSQQVPAPQSRRQKIRDAENQAFVRRAVELFDAEVTRFDDPRK